MFQNKLWCKSTTNPTPVLRIAASCSFMSSHSHSAPSLKISCKSVQPFSLNLANKETKKETNKQNKEIDRKQYPIPRTIGDGINMLNSNWSTS